MMNKIRTVVVAIGALGLLGTGFGTAEAVSAFAPGTIHGCITGTNRVLEHVYTDPSKGLTCPSGSSSVFWEQTNTAGPNGLDVVEVVVNVDMGGVALCPSDHPYVLSGGFSGGVSTSTSLFSQPVLDGGPSGQQQGWGAGGFGSGAAVYAMCAK
jgi:hypothetical protein